MLNLFKKKQNCHVYAPCKGTLIPIEQVKDQMFSQKLLGDGFAIEPKEDTICSPTDGTIAMIANTSHAFGITTDNGAELLVHVGLDTVNLNGEGFEVLAKPNQKVKAGTPILKLDLAFMKEKEMDLTIPVVLTNGGDYTMNQVKRDGEVTLSDEVLNITK